MKTSKKVGLGCTLAFLSMMTGIHAMAADLTCNGELQSPKGLISIEVIVESQWAIADAQIKLNSAPLGVVRGLEFKKVGQKIMARNPVINVPNNPSEENGFGEYQKLAVEGTKLMAVLALTNDGPGFVSLSQSSPDVAATGYISCK